MADIADKAQRHEELMRDLAMSQRAGHLDGPARCLRCGEANDRAKQGYGTCTDCLDDA